MDNIGAEVGQKMRSAIKAKLMELGCYVDDELPDYIMVMVANKRTKSQMNEDLQLFLTTKTAAFVDWLQIVLKKLKEITVTNPDIYKRVSKRKIDDSPKTSLKVKKEKKDKLKVKKLKQKDSQEVQDTIQVKSLTDDLPVHASQLSEMRKIVILQENQNSNSSLSNLENVNEDSFDIPPLSEVAVSNETELVEIEKKIKDVKSRLGLQVQSDSEDEDFLNIKAEPDELFVNDFERKQKESDVTTTRTIQLVRSESIEDQLEATLPPQDSPKPRAEHPRIVFETPALLPKKQSALKRLGKRANEDDGESKQKKTKINLASIRQEEEEILGINKSNKENSLKQNSKRLVNNDLPRESALKRLGVMSKVAIPQKEVIETSIRDEVINKEVPSAIKVKPRVLPPTNKQANKNLLLKAVADAQRSIAQTPVVGVNAKPDALYTKAYREKIAMTSSTGKLLAKDKDRIKDILTSQTNQKSNKREIELSSDDDLEYVPKPVKKSTKSNDLEYIPSVKDQPELDDFNYSNNLPKESQNQTFIITLDGIRRHEQIEQGNETKTKKSPSPIIFNSTKAKVPEKLPVIHPSVPIKIKEKCKYWPGCRQGDKCEFVHPTSPCKAFPMCKFGEKCLYMHPSCKFESSCTRKDCPYSHAPKFIAVVAPSAQTCKYFPNCSNIHCMYYHPKLCKFGKYCKNQSECSFVHKFSNKTNLTWRPNAKH